MKILFLIALCFSHSAFSKLASKDAFPFIINNLDVLVQVSAEGHYRVQRNVEITVQNEAAINFLSQYGFEYNSGNSLFTFLKGEVLNQGKSRQLKATDITHTTLSEFNDIYDPIKKWSINLSDAKVGSKIHLSYLMSYEKNLILKEFYFDLFLLDEGSYIEKGTIRVESSLPMKAFAESPNKNIKLTASKSGDKRVFLFTFDEPFIGLIVGEKRGTLSETKISGLSVVSSATWGSIQRAFASRFELAMNSTLPTELDAVVSEARKKNDLTEQVQFISLHLEKTFKFAGSNRTIKGFPAPRLLSEIYRKKVADDREMATIMVLVLQKLGHKANIALVRKGEAFKTHYLRNILPSISFFNHTVVHLSHQEEEYWIDASHFPGLGLNHDESISGKEGLIFNRDKLQLIPFENPDQPLLDYTTTYKLDEKGNAKIETVMIASGYKAIELRNDYLKESRADFNDKVKRLILMYNKVDHFVLEPYEIKERKLSPLIFKASYEEKNLISVEGELKKLKLPTTSKFYEPLLKSFKDWEGDLYLGAPILYKQTLIYPNVALDENIRLGCSVKSSWFDMERSAVVAKNSLRVTNRIHQKYNFLHHQLFSRPKFAKFQDELKKCSWPGEVSFKK